MEHFKFQMTEQGFVKGRLRRNCLDLAYFIHVDS